MSRDIDTPHDIRNDDGLDEVLRVWIGSDAAIVLRNVFGDQPHNWGMVLADVAIHISRMRLEQENIAETETLQAIEDGYRGRMSEQHLIRHRSLMGRN